MAKPAVGRGLDDDSFDAGIGRGPLQIQPGIGDGDGGLAAAEKIRQLDRRLFGHVAGEAQHQDGVGGDFGRPGAEVDERGNQDDKAQKNQHHPGRKTDKNLAILFRK